MQCKEHQCAKFNYLEKEGKCVGCFLKQKEKKEKWGKKEQFIFFLLCIF